MKRLNKNLASTMMTAAIGLLIFSSTSGYAFDRYETPDLDDVEVISAKINGSGCKQGSGASAYFDGDAIVVEAQDMYAIRGSGHRRSEARRVCQYIIELSVPAGWTYAVESLEGATDSYLSGGTLAEAKFTAYFKSSEGKAKASMSRSSSGYASRDFYLDMDELVYAPCDSKRPLKVKQELRVKGPSSSSSSSRSRSGFAVTELDGPTSLILTWKRCGSRSDDFEYEL